MDTPTEPPINSLLPWEILWVIFQWLGKGKFLCLLVCRLWRALLAREKVEWFLSVLFTPDLKLLHWALENWPRYSLNPIPLNQALLALAAGEGERKAVKFLVSGKRIEPDLLAFKKAAQSGSIEVLKFLLSQPFRKEVRKKQVLASCYKHAARRGRRELLLWLVSNHPLITMNQNFYEGVSKRNPQARQLSSWWETLDIPQGCREVLGVRPCFNAIKTGNLEYLEWLLDSNRKGTKFPFVLNYTHWAAKAGEFAILRWLLSKGFPIHFKAIPYLAGHGARAEIKLLQKQGEPLESSCQVKALKKNQKSMVLWLIKKGVPLPSSSTSFSASVKKGDEELLDLLWNQGLRPAGAPEPVARALRLGRLDLLPWFLKRRFPFPGNSCSIAIKQNNLPLLQWLRAMGFPWEGCSFQNLTQGHRELVLWSAKNGMRLPKTVKKRFLGKKRGPGVLR